MDYIFKWAPLSIVLIFLFYILWNNGYLIISKKTAKLFVGSFRGKKRCSSKFLSCNGYIKKVITLKESGSYEFVFNGNISKGIVIAEIQDESKKIVLKIDKTNPKGILSVDKNCRCYLVLRFEKADGECEITWS